MLFFLLLLSISPTTAQNISDSDCNISLHPTRIISFASVLTAFFFIVPCVSICYWTWDRCRYLTPSLKQVNLPTFPLFPPVPGSITTADFDPSFWNSATGVRLIAFALYGDNGTVWTMRYIRNRQLEWCSVVLSNMPVNDEFEILEYGHWRNIKGIGQDSFGNFVVAGNLLRGDQNQDGLIYLLLHIVHPPYLNSYSDESPGPPDCVITLILLNRPETLGSRGFYGERRIGTHRPKSCVLFFRDLSKRINLDWKSEDEAESKAKEIIRQRRHQEQQTQAQFAPERERAYFARRQLMTRSQNCVILDQGPDASLAWMRTRFWMFVCLICFTAFHLFAYGLHFVVPPAYWGSTKIIGGYWATTPAIFILFYVLIRLVRLSRAAACTWIYIAGLFLVISACIDGGTWSLMRDSTYCGPKDASMTACSPQAECICYAQAPSTPTMNCSTSTTQCLYQTRGYSIGGCGPEGIDVLRRTLFQSAYMSFSLSIMFLLAAIFNYFLTENPGRDKLMTTIVEEYKKTAANKKQPKDTNSSTLNPNVVVAPAATAAASVPQSQTQSQSQSQQPSQTRTLSRPPSDSVLVTQPVHIHAARLGAESKV